MKMKWLLVLLLCAPAALAQNVRKDDILFGSRGIPLANQTVTVCTAAGTGTPCTPVAPVCLNASDTTCTQPNPFTTDALGNWGFWAAPGKYIVTFTGPQIATPKTLTVVLSCDPTAACTHSGTATFTGNLNQTATGVFTNTQMNQPFTGIMGGTNLLTEYQTFQGTGKFSSDALAIGQTVPANAATLTVNGLAVYQNTSSPFATGSTANAIYTQCRTMVNNSKCEGINPIVSDATGQTGVNLLGAEFDVNVNNVGTMGSGILINGAFNVTPTSFPALRIARPGTTQSWSGGIFIDSLAVPATGFGIAMDAGMMRTNSATGIGASGGDIILANTNSLRSAAAANNTTFQLVQGNASNQVVVDPGNQGTALNGRVFTTAAPVVGTNTTDTITGVKTFNSGTLIATSPTLTTPTIGGGTVLTVYRRIAATLSPAAVAANTCAAQSFTVTGLAAADILIGINKPTEQAGLSVAPGHVTGVNTATVNFCNTTAVAITPTAAESYSFVAVQ